MWRNVRPVCWIFIKFATGVIYKKLSMRHEFPDNKRSHGNTLLNKVSLFLPVFSTFPDRLRWNSVQMSMRCHKAITSFMTVKTVKGTAQLTWEHKQIFPHIFCSSRPFYMKFGTDTHKSILPECESRKNRWSENHNLHTGVNGLRICVPSILIVPFW